MFDLKLFLTIQELSIDSDNNMHALLTSGGDYLTQLTIDNKSYIGKPLPSISTLSEIETLENHLMSLVRKIDPNYSQKPILVTDVIRN